MAGLLDTVLDMSLAARMARAREMGFDTARRWYHGTSRELTELVPGREADTRIQIGHRPTNTWDSSNSVFLSSNPEISAEYARQSARNWSNDIFGELDAAPPNIKNEVIRLVEDDGITNRYDAATYMESIKNGYTAGNRAKVAKLLNVNPEGPYIIPAYVKGNYMEVDFGGKPWSERRVSELIREAEENGYDGVKMTNIIDSLSGKKVGDSIAVRRPENIRSIHAAFDPARASSSDLLAGVAPWAMAGGLGLLAGAMPGESRADKLSREMTHREPSRNVSGLERLQAGLQAGGATPVPIASDVMGLLGDALMYYNDPSSRTWTNYGGTALGLLPFVP